MIEVLSAAAVLQRGVGWLAAAGALQQTGGSPAKKPTDQPRGLWGKSPDPRVEFIQVLFKNPTIKKNVLRKQKVRLVS